MLGDAFRDADDEGNFGGDGFFDAGGGNGWAVFDPLAISVCLGECLGEKRLTGQRLQRLWRQFP